MAKRLMFWSSIAFAQKVPKLNWCELPPGRLVRAVENKHMVAFATPLPGLPAHRPELAIPERQRRGDGHRSSPDVQQ
jgi:hypothetical protein